MSREVEQGAGVSANFGKTRVFHAAGGAAPPGILDLGAEVWRGDKLPAERGFVALGIPIGHEDFVRAQAEERLQAEAELRRGLAALPDLQCAWLLLLFCAAPRAQHLLRNVSPALIAGYARAHDDAVWQTLVQLLGGRGHVRDADWEHARKVAMLPASLGGLGLLAAERLAPAAYWASWADALPVLQQRRPDAAARCVQGQEVEAGAEGAAPCLRAAAAAGQRLDREGWEERPTWRGLVGGQSPPSDGNEPSLGVSGWQRHAALALHFTFREQVVLPTANPSAWAMLRSQSGPHTHGCRGHHCA